MQNKIIFYQHMQKNIFCTKESEKLEKEIKISNVFPIYIKNPSNLELKYLKRENYKKIFSIISIFPNLTYLFETEECLNDPKYYAFKRQIYDIRSLYRKNKNTKIEEYVKNNDITGSFKLQMKTGLKLYITSSYRYLELRMDYTKSVSISIKKKCKKGDPYKMTKKQKKMSGFAAAAMSAVWSAITMQTARSTSIIP